MQGLYLKHMEVRKRLVPHLDARVEQLPTAFHQQVVEGFDWS